MAYFRETDCGIIAGMKKAHLCPSLQKIRRYPLLLKEHLKNKNILGYENKRHLVCQFNLLWKFKKYIRIHNEVFFYPAIIHKQRNFYSPRRNHCVKD